jgi:hypothetical protein
MPQIKPEYEVIDEFKAIAIKLVEKYPEILDEHSHTEHDVDIGQIAVDVLDLTDEIIIVAPIA